MLRQLPFLVQLMATRCFSTRPLVVAVLLAISLPTLGQAVATNNSDAWMARVRRLPLPEQVAAVRARVLSDTVLRHPRQYVCLMPLSAAARQAYDRAQQPRAQAELARPAGVLPLYVVDDYSLSTNYPAQTAIFLQQLDAKHIRYITYLPSGVAAAAIYGSRGANGVVILSSAKAKRR